MKRFILFIAVNLLIMLAVTLVVNIFHIQPYLTRTGINYRGLLIFCSLFGFGGAFISLQLSRVAAKWSMGVQLLDPENPGSPREARIVDIVRAACRKAGLSHLPEIGVYQSPEVNAFATGPSRRRALLAISSGLLDAMDERAIEGVVGHEISHIVNGDMVTMTLVQGVVNTFVYFAAQIAAFAIENAMRSRDEEGRGGLGFFAQYILIYALETGLMFLASPLIYAFSRWREYRADAGSARLEGRDTMIHALESLKTATQVVDSRAPAYSAFKINGRGHGLWALLFASHPPIDARIRALQRGG